MSLMKTDGKVYYVDGSWWSPYGNTDKEIRENLKMGQMPNVPDGRVPRAYIALVVASAARGQRDEQMSDFLEDIGAINGKAKESYEKRKK